MPSKRTIFMTVLAMIAFAANSLLCRMALKSSGMDPATFTSIRIISGAAALWLISSLRSNRTPSTGNWLSALALFAYAAGFSYAYITLPAASGALLLFGAVQTTMIGYGLWSGERLGGRQWGGLFLAFSGVAILLLPGLSAPSWSGSVLMLTAGVAWGIYSLRGRGVGDPTGTTAGNFLRAVPVAVVVSALTLSHLSVSPSGIMYAACSGAVASGVGYALWYMALRGLQATSAATVQLSVPVLTAMGGVLCLDEAITIRLLAASAAILGGIALVIVGRRPPQPEAVLEEGRQIVIVEELESSCE